MNKISVLFLCIVLAMGIYNAWLNAQLSNEIIDMKNTIQIMKEDIIFNRLQNNDNSLRILQDEKYLMEIYTEIFPIKKSSIMRK